MCEVREMAWSHRVRDAELESLIARYASVTPVVAFLRGLETEFPEDGLRPPVSVVVIVCEQVSAMERGVRSEFGDALLPGTQSFSYGAYRYGRDWEGRLKAIVRYMTPLMRAIHDDLPHMLMSARLMAGFNRLLDRTAGVQLAPLCCCGGDCVRTDRLADLLASPRLREIEDARARGRNIETIRVGSVWGAMPDNVPELGSNDRDLHERVRRVMIGLCGPVERADDPFVPRSSLALAG